ncbi:BHLH domain-containing protein [Psidium guajava]|nr:BHLH domain-containing protein [Psidium guajava]
MGASPKVDGVGDPTDKWHGPESSAIAQVQARVTDLKGPTLLTLFDRSIV